jgi:UDP-glucose 4-epimerase
MSNRLRKNNSKNKKLNNVLLTGATGFVGKYVVDELVRRGVSLTVLVRKKKNDIPKSVKQIVCDLEKITTLRPYSRSLIKYKTVIHLAAEIPNAEKKLNMNIGNQFNKSIEMVTNLLEVTSPRHIIFTSTLDIYGHTSNIPIKERSAYAPLTLYGSSKAATEILLKQYCQSNNITLTTLRLSQVYGNGDSLIKFIPIVTDQVLKNKRPVLFNKGADTRDYIHVQDVARAVYIAFQKGRQGTFNISTGKETRLKDVLDTIISASGNSIKPIHKKSQDQITRSCLCPNKAKDELEFTAKIPFRLGLTKMIHAKRPTIVFDFDGTLLNVQKRYYNLYSDLFNGKHILSEKDYWSLKRKKVPEKSIYNLTKDLGNNVHRYVSKRIRLIERYDYLNYDLLFPWSKKLLHDLAKDYHLILLSLRRKPLNFKKQIKQLGINDYFDDAFSVNPEPFVNLADAKASVLYELKGRFVAMIGDTEADIRAAQLLNIPSFAVLSGIREYNLLKKEKPTAIIRDARGVRQYL